MNFSLNLGPSKPQPPKPSTSFISAFNQDDHSDDEKKTKKVKTTITSFKTESAETASSPGIASIPLPTKGSEWRIALLKKKLGNKETSLDERAKIILQLEAMGIDGDSSVGDRRNVGCIQITTTSKRKHENLGDSDYSMVSVDDFGKALLNGMGYNNGNGTWKNKQTKVYIKDPVRRVDRLGLGADPTAKLKKLDEEAEEAKKAMREALMSKK
uniref:G-patch_2 domain-containing protein n=1 Tax=Rhabditophanes sp. KR3021 TaxID=114890 RepID=A0AC35UH39_9BILA